MAMNQIVNRRREGYWELYFDDNDEQLLFKGNFIKGRSHGYCEKYWSNGQLEYRGNFFNGKIEGYLECHYYSGELRLQEIYL